MYTILDQVITPNTYPKKSENQLYTVKIPILTYCLLTKGKTKVDVYLCSSIKMRNQRIFYLVTHNCHVCRFTPRTLLFNPLSNVVLKPWRKHYWVSPRGRCYNDTERLGSFAVETLHAVDTLIIRTVRLYWVLFLKLKHDCLNTENNVFLSTFLYAMPIVTQIYVVISTTAILAYL